MNPMVDGEARHWPLLEACLQRCSGPVLELGCSNDSTTALHAWCAATGRELISYESDKVVLEQFLPLQSASHQLVPVEDWASLPWETPWSVALLCPRPSERRFHEATRLASLATFILCRDTDNPDMGWDASLPSFKYAYTEARTRPWTTVVSNHCDLQFLGDGIPEYLWVGDPLETARQARVMIGVPVKNCGRFLNTFVDQIAGQDFDFQRLSIVFLENDSTDDSWPLVQQAARRLRELDIEVACEQMRFGFDCPHTSRHLDTVQVDRLRCIAAARQHVVDHYFLPSERTHLMWFDADFEEIPADALTKLVAANRDIVTPVLRVNHGSNNVQYDLGSYGRGLGVQQMLDRYPTGAILPLETVNAAALFTRRVFAAVDYRDPAPGDQEGNVISRRASAAGFSLAVHTGVWIRHASVVGNAPLASIGEAN